jgi:type IV secretory pathway TraG/TraD family ATPase VirD4
MQANTESPLHHIPFYSSLPPGLQSPELLGVAAIAVGGLLTMSVLDKGAKRKGILAKSEWAKAAEVEANRKKALEQIRKQKHNEIGLWIGSSAELGMREHSGKKYLYVPDDPSRVYLSDCQGSILVIAGPGSGKSLSITDPLTKSAIWQGKSILMFDFKGYEEGETSLAPSSSLAGFAKSLRYKVFVLAPGCAESDCLNVLDFLDDQNDADNAFQMGDTLVKNFGLSEGGNPFFEQTGAMLCQALMMLAKGQDGDIALCSKLLALPKLVDRLANTPLSEYQRSAFDNFLSSSGSPETASSIAATAQTMFSRFMSPDILSVFARPTTVPLQLHGRQMLIFRINPKKKALVMPVVAAAIDMLLRRSIFAERRNSLFTNLEEVAVLKLEDLDEFLNTGRSAGSCFCLATQSIGLAEGTYGKEKFEAIMGGCGTQIIGRLNENETSKYYEEALGKEDISYKQKSSSYGKSGDSTSHSDQQQTRSLMEIQEWGQLLVGEFVILNPGQGNKKKARLPFKVRIIIPLRDVHEKMMSGKVWRKFKAHKIKHRVAYPYTEAELRQRRLRADEILPLPPDAIEQEVAINY